MGHIGEQDENYEQAQGPAGQNRTLKNEKRTKAEQLLDSRSEDLEGEPTGEGRGTGNQKRCDSKS